MGLCEGFLIMGYLDYYKSGKGNPNDIDDLSNQMSKMYDKDSMSSGTGSGQDFSPAYQAPGSATNAATSKPTTSGQGVDGAKVVTDAGAGAAVGGPWGAGIAAVGSLASQYLAQKAADERAKRERYAAIQKGYGEDQQQAINQIMSNNARALR